MMSAIRPEKKRTGFLKAWIVTIVVSVCLVFPGATIAFLRFRYSPEALWIHNLYVRKVCALRERREHGPAPALVTIGGSAGLFGIDAELIEKKLGTPCVNMNTHGALGLEYHIARLKRELRREDTALLSFELEAFYLDPEITTNTLKKYFWTYDHEFLWGSKLKRKLELLYLNPGEDYLRQFASNRAAGAEGSGRYGYVTLSPNGDYRGRPREVAFQPQNTPEELHPKAVAMLHELSIWSRQQGIRLLFTWPPMAETKPEFEPVRHRLCARIRQALESADIPILDSPEENEFPPEYCIDTQYHLKEFGRRIKTERLIQALRPILGKAPAPRGRPGLYVMRGRACPTTPDNLFADRPIDFRCLTSAETAPNGGITLEGIREALREGMDVYCGNAEAAEALADAGFDSSPAGGRSAITLADWIRARPNDLLILTRCGSESAQFTETDSEPSIQEFLRGTDFESGLFRNGKAIAMSRSGTPIELTKSIHLDGFCGLPDVPAVIRSGPRGAKPLEEPPIRLGGEYIGDAGEGLHAASIDPRLGIVTGAATFRDGMAEEFPMMKVTLATKARHAVQ